MTDGTPKKVVQKTSIEEERSTWASRINGWKEDIDRELKRIRPLMNKSEGEAKANYKKQLDALNTWKKKLNREAKKLAESDEESWKKTKRQVKKTLNSIEVEWKQILIN